MITNSRKHRLYHNYVLPIWRDPSWVDAVRGASQEHLRRVSLGYIGYLQKTHNESTNLEERCYIYLALWTNLGNTVQSFIDNSWSSTMLTHLRQLAKDYPPETPTQAPTQTPEETPMTTPAFETKHYIYGTDATKLTASELIAAIGKVENEIAQLKSIKSKSTHIAAQVAALDGMRNSIVTLLDATGGAQ